MSRVHLSSTAWSREAPVSVYSGRHVRDGIGRSLFAVGATLAIRRVPGNPVERVAMPVRTTTVAGMSDVPFGFGPGSGGDPDKPGEFPGMQMFAQLQHLLNWQGGAVNWDLARQLAMQGLAGADADVPAAERKEVADAIRLAD